MNILLHLFAIILTIIYCVDTGVELYFYYKNLPPFLLIKTVNCLVVIWLFLKKVHVEICVIVFVLIFAVQRYKRICVENQINCEK